MFLLVLAAIIVVMGLLIAMFGPGNTNLKYSEKEALDGPTVVINGGKLTFVLFSIRLKSTKSDCNKV